MTPTTCDCLVLGERTRAVDGDRGDRGRNRQKSNNKADNNNFNNNMTNCFRAYKKVPTYCLNFQEKVANLQNPLLIYVGVAKSFLFATNKAAP